MTPKSWHLLTGVYPPDNGGVADYTAVVAHALTAAGQTVHVWTTGDTPDVESDGLAVHRVAGRFGPQGLAQLGRGLDRGLDRFPGPRTILVQYVPHAFGLKAMNLPFAGWVLGRARRGDDIRVMFHEVAYPWVRRPLRHNLIAAANRLMAALLVRACSRAYISTPAWEPLLRQAGIGPRPVVWTPIPTNIPTDPSPAAVAARRAEVTAGRPDRPVVGHFGTYGPLVAPGLAAALRPVLEARSDVRVVLIGTGGDRWRREFAGGRPDWAERITAPGNLPVEQVAEFLRACDVVVQPYPDGATTRRTTLMAALANGVPVATTLGPLSEPIWKSAPVATVPAEDPGRLAEAVLGLLGRPAEAIELGRAGRRLYDDRFSVGRTVEALLADSPSGARP